MRALITKFKMPTSNVKWCIQARKTLAPDTFKNYMLAIFSMFPESQAKLLANSYIGELGRKYSRKDHGFTCSSLDTAQCIWTSALAENRDVIIDSYQNPNTKQELYLIRERQIERIFFDDTSINRFVICQSILKCLNMLHDNASHDNNGNGISQVYAINTDGVFMTNVKNQYPYKKDLQQIVSDKYSKLIAWLYISRNITGRTLTLIITLIIRERVLFIMVEPAVVKHIDYAKRH